MDNSIYIDTISHILHYGMPVSPNFVVNFVDTNYFSNMNVISNSTPYGIDYFRGTFNEMPIIMPEVIFQECAGLGKQANMNHERFHALYSKTFEQISASSPIHLVTFSDLEEHMVSGNGGKKNEAFTKAKLIAEELFSANGEVIAALAAANNFNEIEGALRVSDKDAGERVIIFYAAILQEDYWTSIVFSNETSVYVDRYTNSSKTKLLELLGNMNEADYFSTFIVKSLDVTIFDYLMNSGWDDTAIEKFIFECRPKKGRKIRISNKIADYSNIVSCNDNTDFFRNFIIWRKNQTTINF